MNIYVTNITSFCDNNKDDIFKQIYINNINQINNTHINEIYKKSIHKDSPIHKDLKNTDINILNHAGIYTDTQ